MRAVTIAHEPYCDRCGDTGMVSRQQIGLQPAALRCSCYLVNPVLHARHEELIVSRHLSDRRRPTRSVSGRVKKTKLEPQNRLLEF